MTTMRERRAELLEDVVAQTAQLLGDFLPTVAADIREQISHAVADRMAVNWGGQVISIPKDTSYRNSARDRAILADSSTMTISELSAKYGPVERTIRYILKRAALREVPLNQGDFFPE